MSYATMYDFLFPVIVWVCFGWLIARATFHIIEFFFGP